MACTSRNALHKRLVTPKMSSCCCLHIISTIVCQAANQKVLLYPLAPKVRVGSHSLCPLFLWKIEKGPQALQFQLGRKSHHDQFLNPHALFYYRHVENSSSSRHDRKVQYCTIVGIGLSLHGPLLGLPYLLLRCK